ncbi:MAG: LamG domain-containing protein [Verrucomicrobia bacterium]|nr:LamG domain-containing protein [Verrucomicrobiota bacterium]
MKRLLCLFTVLLANQLYSAEEPAAYLPLDEEVRDASSNTHAFLDPYKTLTYSPGVVGMAANFKGKNLIRTPNKSKLNFSDNLTIGGWIKLPESSEGDSIAYGIFRRWEHEHGQFSIEIAGKKNTGGRMIAFLSTDGAKLIHLNSPVQVVPNEWFYVVFVYRKESNKAELYVEPRSSTELNPPAELQLEAPLHHAEVAEFVIGHGMGSHFYSGLIDEVVVFEKALERKDIGLLFLQGKNGKSALAKP